MMPIRQVFYMQKKCPECGASNHFTESKCIDCGFVFKPPVVHTIADDTPFTISPFEQGDYASSLKNLMSIVNTLFILILLLIILPTLYLVIFDFGLKSFWQLILGLLSCAVVCVTYYLVRLLLESYRVVVEAAEHYLKHQKRNQ